MKSFSWFGDSDDQHHNQHLSHEEVGHFLQQTKGPRRSFPNKLIAPRVPLGQISANHVHRNNYCHDASQEASIATTRAPTSKALQFNAGIPKHNAHSVSWKNFFFLFFPEILWICKSPLMFMID
jgi:hypothetical protein